MRKFLLKAIVPVMFLICGFTAAAQDMDGVATWHVQDYRKLEENPVAVDGEWDFFWSKFVNPRDFTTPGDLKVEVPSNWNYYELDDEAMELARTGKGAGSYRIRITGLKPSTSYGFFTYNFAATSFELYCNGQLSYMCGDANIEWQKTKAASNMDIATFRSDSKGVADIVIYVSNEFHRQGGLWSSFRIQEEKSIYSWYNRKVCQNSLLLGVLMTVVLYGLLVAILRRDKANLYLALYVFAIFIRCFSAEFPLMKHMFDTISYPMMLRHEYIALFMAPAFYTLYVNALDKEIFGKVKAWIFCIPALALGVADILLPIQILNKLVPVMQIYLFAILIVDFIFIFASLVKHKSVTSIFTMATILIIGLGCLNDVFSASENFIFSGVKILNISFVIYAFCQTAFLAYIQNKNQVTVTAINDDLSKTNTTFNKFIPEEMISYISDKSATEIESGEYKHEKMGILCCDVRNFTPISKTLKEDQVFNVLNEFFQKIVPVIRKHGGMVEKYVGDGVLALFPNGAEDAIMCGLEIQQRLRELREDFRSMELPPLKAGIGIHYGDVLVGIAGDDFRISEVVISDNMYIVKQTEELTKNFKKGIVVTREAVKAASETAKLRGKKFEFSGIRLSAANGQPYYAIYNDRVPADL